MEARAQPRRSHVAHARGAHRAGLVLCRHAGRAGVRRRPLLHAGGTTRRRQPPPRHARARRGQFRRLSDGERHHAARQPFPRPRGAARPGLCGHRTPARRAGGRNLRPGHLRARRHRLGGRDPHLPGGTRQLFGRRPHRHGGQPALRRARDHGIENLRPPHRLAELDLPAAERGRPGGRAAPLRHGADAGVRHQEGVTNFPSPVYGGGARAKLAGRGKSANASASGFPLPALPRTRGREKKARRAAMDIMNVDYSEKIPNNVNLTEDRRVLRALEGWHPGYLDWWNDMGPNGFQESLVYLRTAYSVDPRGWAKFDYVRMPDYRWGILLAPPEPDRKVPFGQPFGEPAWQEVPGEHRAMLRRLVVIQGDTEPASVEQQRHLGKTAPSLYDMRTLFQVNVEEGRHLWAMVYLLHKYFGRDGREEAEGLLQRHSGDADKPRILGTFNEPVSDWLSFFMFTYFTDRDGKFQLKSLAESGFDPLARTCQFMLTEEAHHMFVGETGIGRVVKRTLEVMKELGSEDPAAVRRAGAVDLPTMQKYLNFWFSSSLDLFGAENSSNAATYFATGIKGRPDESNYQDHTALNASFELAVPDGETGVKNEEIALRNAMNEVTRGAYIRDCDIGVKRWNRLIAKAGFTAELTLPSPRFRRSIGAWAGRSVDPGGMPIAAAS